MTELLTSAQMRANEHAAIASGEVTGLELMERAGRGVVDAIFEHWWTYRQRPHRAVILCGPGNNGGDGYVVARLLRDLNWDVTVFALGDPERLPPDALTNYNRWVETGRVAPLTLANYDAYSDAHGPADLYIDALFGTGITRPVTGDAWEVLGRLVGMGQGMGVGPVVAVDAPSGLCMDSGRLLGAEGAYAWGLNQFAALTVTFDCPKVGHYLADGPGLCGRLAVVDIGIQKWRGQYVVGKAAQSVWLAEMTPDDLGARAVTLPVKQAWHAHHGQTHKYSHGHAMVVTGGEGHTGAARLAARGALRIGAGLVTLAVPGPAMPEVAAQITAVMMREISDARALDTVLEDERLNALCIGPGLGFGPARADLVRAVLQAKRPTVLDADALTLLAEHEELRDLLHDGCILTPHGGEFARLFPDIAAKLTAPRLPKPSDSQSADLAAHNAYRSALAAQTGPAYSKVDAVREAAKRAGCTVLLKGADTVIARPEGAAVVHAAVYDRAAPWLATAGSGDVLAGIMTGLLAMGQTSVQAAAGAVWMHTECARAFGPGLIAEDLPEQIPTVVKALVK
ncbi:NAD(P)H-hydrate epimerase [Pseudoprimorskyibacter insulae]|uniref:Bifunctional NAD(P)H-hydrate repair enzyme n=1 Tax=Pseudoprimorskyibacter insulae TaxID=1695997 RepID=A0A2R8AXU1_9RHOB|nr:NAD(P)H-hydrate epimerase [Pseudoprimorskyibacter insulae]SPF80853.1 Bifunctional NAD(P)H-hydrate repair enzyme Nnr [Pseudoprimorskyibacter insulae]